MAISDYQGGLGEGRSSLKKKKNMLSWQNEWQRANKKGENNSLSLFGMHGKKNFVTVSHARKKKLFVVLCHLPPEGKCPRGIGFASICRCQLLFIRRTVGILCFI